MAFQNFEILSSILQCPQCASALVETTFLVKCPQCDQEIRKLGQCVVFVSEDLPADFEHPAYTSSNPYTWDSLQLIEQHRQGVVLDLGAGQPNHDFSNVIQLEIRKYPSTDIVITEGKLPLQDNSVDGVISEAVLEHVQDPFLYVAEIYRVLKPKGTCLLNAAFLQPLHGAPYHFFNTTHHALELLFQDFQLEKLQVGPHQHPWITLRWMLQSYINGMRTEEDRETFRNQTVRDLEKQLLGMHDKRTEVKKNPNIYERAHNLLTFNQDHAQELGPLLQITPETETELAAGFELIGRKEAGSPHLSEKWQHYRAKSTNLLRARKLKLSPRAKTARIPSQGFVKQQVRRVLNLWKK